jgi:HSP20 family molecular chaperone IbpA
MSEYNNINYNQIIRDDPYRNNYNNAVNWGELLRYGLSSENQLWNPAIDLMESVNNILLNIYIPGVSKDSINISFMANYIVISGRREAPNYQDNIINNHPHEIIYGNFERRIKLPIIVNDKENVTITLSNGVLSVIINKDIDYNTLIFESDDIEEE